MEDLKVGDKVVMKTDWRTVFILLQLDTDNTSARLLTPDGKEVVRPLIALEKYDAKRAFGI